MMKKDANSQGYRLMMGLIATLAAPLSAAYHDDGSLC